MVALSLVPLHRVCELLKDLMEVVIKFGHQLSPDAFKLLLDDYLIGVR